MTEETQDTQSVDEVGEMPSGFAFALPPAMTIEEAEAMASIFKEIPVFENMTLTLDASAVENLTTPGAQILVSLEKTILAHGGKLIVCGQKEPFGRALADIGLQRLLG